MDSWKTTARGRQLQKLFKEGFIECINNNNTTFAKNDYEEQLDWILASQPLLSFISNVETHLTLDALSGHKPLNFDIPIEVESKSTSPRISLNFKAAKWSKFRSISDQQLMLWHYDHHLDSTLDIKEHTSFINTSILVTT
ncbi:unnamed protein product [Rotaria sordida]|uniref:Endonuclease/exonuclease/phosphatase domain-containing protein n=1 Tax=Rotaria sordida TaxID=392033 RepID=A0A819TXU3_9BILA|nr:unnamed protein product [Rotaria sordida]CAF4086873.1 unnamed protein product [Rotaria sordida]